MFTTRHYAAIAAELAAKKPPKGTGGWPLEAYDEWVNIVYGLADMFQSDNKRFKRHLFMEAAGAPQ